MRPLFAAAKRSARVRSWAIGWALVWLVGCAPIQANQSLATAASAIEAAEELPPERRDEYSLWLARARLRFAKRALASGSDLDAARFADQASEAARQAELP